MGRIILGVIVGFVVWSILWVGSAAIMSAASADYAQAMADMKFSNFWLIVAIVRSVVFSVVSGYLAVQLSKEVSKTTLGLGVFLLLFGIFVQVNVWNVFPVWYHLVFLALLIPMTIVGGKLKQS